MMLPVLAPVAVGENVTFTEQLALGAIGDPETQLSVSEKSPAAETLRKLSAELPAFVTVSVCGVLEP